MRKSVDYASAHVRSSPNTVHRSHVIDMIASIALTEPDLDSYALLESALGAWTNRTVSYRRSSSMLNIAQTTIWNLLLPLPPLAEQTAIAAFLDRETAQD